MTETTLSHLEFLGPELSKPPVPGKLGWLSPVVLSASFFRLCWVWKTALENIGLLGQGKGTDLSLPLEVCPFQKPNTPVLHLNFDGQDVMSWGIPWGFFPPV